MINCDHPIFDAARVAPRLWIGSHPPVPGHRCADHHHDYGADLASGGFGFLALCAEEYQPGAALFPGVEVCHAPFDDDHKGIDDRQMRIAFQAARDTVDAHRRGLRCLVTCWAGRNRSGLVTALALAELAGCSSTEAGQIVRDKRGLAALTNLSFRGILGRVGKNPLRLPLAKTKTCALCEAKPITRRYHEDAICWIADCKDCRVPMVVYRAHGVTPPPGHIKHMLALLVMCGKPSRRGHYLDNSMRSIPDHWHTHLRPA